MWLSIFLSGINQPMCYFLFFFYFGNNQRAIRMASPVPDLDTSLPQTLVPLFGTRRGSDPGNIQKSKKSNICGCSLSIFSWHQLTICDFYQIISSNHGLRGEKSFSTSPTFRSSFMAQSMLAGDPSGWGVVFIDDGIRFVLRQSWMKHKPTVGQFMT